MAASLNRVFLIGNLTRDPELRYVPSGTAVANFDIAVNRVYSAQSGEKKEETSFIKVVVWARRAEVCAEYLGKGSPVLVEGRLRSRSWETQEGQKRSTIEVVANNVQFLKGASRKGPQDSSPAGAKKMTAEASGAGAEAIDLNKEGSQGTGAEEIPF